MSDAVDCSEAYKNPSCPYVTQININTTCMKQVDKALTSEECCTPANIANLF